MKIQFDSPRFSANQLVELQFIHVFISFVLIGLNLGIATLVQRSGSFYVANSSHWLFSMGLIPSLFILSLIISTLIFLKLKNFAMIVSIIIIAGATSNFLEKFVFFGAVTDYLPAQYFSSNLGYFNIADIQIWLGLFVLNILVFFGNKIPWLSA